MGNLITALIHTGRRLFRNLITQRKTQAEIEAETEEIRIAQIKVKREEAIKAYQDQIAEREAIRLEKVACKAKRRAARKAKIDADPALKAADLLKKEAKRVALEKKRADPVWMHKMDQWCEHMRECR